VFHDTQTFQSHVKKSINIQTLCILIKMHTQKRKITRSEGNSTVPSQANLRRRVKGFCLHRVCLAARKPYRPLSTQIWFGVLSCENIFSSSRSCADICLPFFAFHNRWGFTALILLPLQLGIRVFTMKTTM